MVFDKFKSWRKGVVGPTVECPLCHTKNPEDASECSQCLYQLGKAAFEQVAAVDEEAAGTLFDELLADFDDDEEEEVIDWSKGTFTMDDVTIDVEQYGDGDGIKLSANPTFAMTVDHPDPVEEDEGDYELTAADAPEFVIKFEMPEMEEEPLEEIQAQQIELVQPTAEAAENVEVVAADAIPDRNGARSAAKPAKKAKKVEVPEPESEEVAAEVSEPVEAEPTEAEVATVEVATVEVGAEAEPEVAEVAAEAEVGAESGPAELTEDSLLSLKKVELVEMAEEAGLSTSGTKAELAARIIAGPQEEEPEEEPKEEVQPEAAPEPEPEVTSEPEPEPAPEPVPDPAPEPAPASKPMPAPEPPIVVPAAPAGMPVPPPVAARAVDPMDAAFDGRKNIPLADANAVMGRPTPPRIPKIPKVPKMPHIAEANAALDTSANNGFWPWPQQEEWSNRDVAMKIKEAMEAAKRRDVAQVTVLLDEVGPHLGERTKLLYPVGALLQRIGRASAVDRMIAAAVAAQPNDQHVQTAKAKLRP